MNKQDPPVLHAQAYNIQIRLFLQQLRHRLIEPSPRVQEPDRRRQATLLSACLLGFIILAAVVEIFTALLIDWETYTGYRQTMVAVAALAVVYVLSRTHHVQLAATLAVIVASVAVFMAGLGEPRGVLGGLLDFLILPLWLGSLFIELKRLSLLIIVILIGLLVFPLVVPEVALNLILVGPFSFLLVTSIILLILTRHRNRLERDRQQDLLAKERRSRREASRSETLLRVNTRLYADLSRAYDSTIEGWSRALDLRDKETEGHTQRVTQMTLRLARAMGLSDDELVHIRRGALLHDIGKMGVPDHILLKPGKLTDEEWQIMQKHPVYAYELLSPIAYLRPTLDIPYCNHEKWDGSGYPRRLRGEQIPFAARLFAIVDVVDALRSDRPYREGWPEEQVLAYIREQSGIHFDPQVVAAFLDLDNDG